MLLSIRSASALWGLSFLLLNLSLTQAQESTTIPVIDTLDGYFPLDEQGRLNTYALLFDAAACQADDAMMRQVEHLRKYNDQYFEVVAGLEGDARETVLGPYSSTTTTTTDNICRAACLDIGVEEHLIGHVMAHKIYDSSTTHGNLQQWFQDECAKVEVCLMSYHKNTLDVYWKEPTSQNLKLHVSLQYGEKNTRCFHSYLGHEFVAKEQETQQEIASGKASGSAWFTVEYTAVHYWGASPPHPTRTSRFGDDEGALERQVTSTLNHEWQRHNRIQRTFSKLGFAKGRLPPDVFATLGAFYYNNARRQWRQHGHHEHNHPTIAREEWNSKGVFVNWWETDVFLLQIPWDLRDKIQGRLLYLVEQWAGTAVEQTVMYGLRQYTTGARLLTHVDRHVTHAVSLIVNIAQGNLTEPWPVEVHDHADRLHEVVMEPGDIVYYESAKCLHGRNRPMQGPGAYFVNLFTHYAPVGDKEWFTRANPAGTPQPVLGPPVEEECFLENRGLARTGPTGHSVGIVQGVKCPRRQEELGPYLSPTLFQAESGDDLLHWWRMTGGMLSDDDEDGGGIVEMVDEGDFDEEDDVEEEEEADVPDEL